MGAGCCRSGDNKYPFEPVRDVDAVEDIKLQHPPVMQPAKPFTAEESYGNRNSTNG